MTLAHDQRLKAALSICGAMIVAVSCDTIVKHLSAHYPIHLVNTIRFALTIPTGLYLVYRERAFAALFPPQIKLLTMRGLLIALGNLFFMLAAATIPLADGVALFFTMPFFVAGVVPFLIGERVPLIRWITIAVGFIGVIIMTRPGTTLFQPEALLAVLCAFFYGIGQVLTRRIDPKLPTAITALWQGGVYTVFYISIALVFGFGLVAPSGNASLDFLTRAWAMPTGSDFGLMALAGLLSCAQIPLQVAGYRLAASSFVAPFEYTAMIWAVIYGVIVFGDIPDQATLIGACVVAAAGLIMLQFDRK
jgi:drug/metabolite transporter (DMT)-like permease